jgi:hypothetical protein
MCTTFTVVKLSSECEQVRRPSELLHSCRACITHIFHSHHLSITIGIASESDNTPEPRHNINAPIKVHMQKYFLAIFALLVKNNKLQVSRER